MSNTSISTSSSSTLNLLSLPNILLIKIFSHVENDRDRIWLYYSCKRLNIKTLITIKSVEYRWPGQIEFASLLDRVSHITVSHYLYQHLHQYLELLQPDVEYVGDDGGDHDDGGLMLTSLTIIDYKDGAPPLTIPSYITRLTIKAQSSSSRKLDTIILHPLPPRLKELMVDGPLMIYLKQSKLPNTLEILGMNIIFHVDDEQPYKIPTSIKTLYIFQIQPPYYTNSNQSYNIERMDIGFPFLPEISDYNLPNTLTHLKLGTQFNSPIRVTDLPPNLRVLELGESFASSLLSTSLPQTLQKLILGYRFNKPLLPNSLHEGLTSLTFGQSFNQPIPPGILPSTLQHLHFGYEFNQPLQKGSLPNGLERLLFGYAFDQELEVDVLPTTLTTLHFGTMFSQMLEIGVLPSKQLTTLKIGGHKQSSPLMSASIPHSVTHLDLSEYTRTLRMGIIPPSVVYLIMPNWFNSTLEVGVIPQSPSLETVIFGDKFNQPIRPGTFIKSIKRIDFGADFNRPLPRKILPDQLHDIGINQYAVNQLYDLPPTVSIIRIYSHSGIYSPDTRVKLFKSNTIYANRNLWSNPSTQIYLNDHLISW